MIIKTPFPFFCGVESSRFTRDKQDRIRCQEERTQWNELDTWLATFWTRPCVQYNHDSHQRQREPMGVHVLSSSLAVDGVSRRAFTSCSGPSECGEWPRPRSTPSLCLCSLSLEWCQKYQHVGNWNCNHCWLPSLTFSQQPITVWYFYG